jgi:hypothetical protein
MAQALMGGIELGMEDKKERELTAAMTAHNSGMAERILGAGGAPAASPVTAALSVPEGRGVTAPADLAPIFDEASKATGIPAPILMAKVRQESNFNPGAIGKAGEVGLTQVLPSTARDPGFGMQGVDPSALRDPKTNIMFGAQYLAARARAAGVKDWNDPQQVAKALTAYNGGGDPNYAQNVMRFAPKGMFAMGGGTGQATLAGGDNLSSTGGPDRMSQLLRDYNHPMTTPDNKRLILSEIERLRKGADPAAALELDIKREQLRKLREKPTNPAPEAIQKLEAVGIDRATMQAAIKDPQHPFHKIVSNALGGGVNNSVTVKNEGQIPPGHEAIRDAAGNLTGYRKVPGSPQAEAAENQTAMQKKAANVVVDTITDIEKTIKDTRLPTTGFFGNASAKIPGTPAHNVMANLETVAANISFDKLNEMRKASPTGGALGNVTEKELDLLKASMAALRQSQGSEQFQKNLQRVKDNFLDVIHGPGKRPTDAAAGKENDPMGLR